MIYHWTLHNIYQFLLNQNLLYSLWWYTSLLYLVLDGTFVSFIYSMIAFYGTQVLQGWTQWFVRGGYFKVLDVYIKKPHIDSRPCLEILLNCCCIGIFHESEWWMKYPFTKIMNLISRQGYITNWFLFLCRTAFVLNDINV